MISPIFTLEQAQKVVDDYCGQPAPIKSLSELVSCSYSAFTSTKSYKVVLENGVAYIIKIAQPSSNDKPVYAPNTLSAEHALLSALEKNNSIPQATLYKLDTSLSLIPFPYLLLEDPRGIPLAAARASGRLTPRQSLELDLRIGHYFRQVHDHIQNDWFGLPAHANEELYSWQEAFTYMFEGLLHDAHALGVDLPYETVRRSLSRAIGFFLFDDCEVPSLVSLVGDDETIIVDFDPENPPAEDEAISITALIPSSHALWGDPLLEVMFIDPTAAFLEGYGGSPIVFARQKTKRMWYTLFLALVVLVESMRPNALRSENEGREGKVKWAKEILPVCVEKLKNAPCY